MLWTIPSRKRIRLRQRQTSAPDKQPDHQPRRDDRGSADIDDDRLGARTVHPSGGLKAALDRLAAQQGEEARRCYRDDAR